MPLILNQEIVAHSSLDNFGLSELLYDIHEYANPHVTVGRSRIVKGQMALIALEDIPVHSVIFVYTNEVSRTRTRTSIQIGASEHIEAGDFGSFTNHSCRPNAIVRGFVHYCTEIGTAALITIHPIHKGEEINFDYATTETDLTEELKQSDCLCGSALCRGKVMHFGQLDADDQVRLIENNLVADHISKLYAGVAQAREVLR